MAAANYDLYIEQGATFTLKLIWKDDAGNPIDLTGYTARMQIRKNYADAPAISLTTESVTNPIVLGGALGTIDIGIDAETTEDITISRGIYDLELQIGDTVTRLIEGGVEISREVTKDG